MPLHRPVLARSLAILSGLAIIALAWWTAVAGPLTVWRTLVYNFSGIDDHRLFPQRRMSAAPQPFRFHSGGAGQMPDALPLADGRVAPLDTWLDATDTVAFLVVKDDAIVREWYRAGYTAATPSLSFSMAKSFLSVVVGCALADGYLRWPEQPVTDFVPELKPRGFAAVTLQHLLQMTAGVDYAENDLPFGIHPRFYYTDRLEREILRLRLREPPGTRFRYKSGDVYLLTLALHRALRGKGITRYMEERLWHPLGMEADGFWSIDHVPDGLEKTGCCLAATARDFAKFGRLYLKQGEWNGRRIVDADWVRRSTRPDRRPGSAWNYQNLWWLVAPDRPDFMARGHLGQFLYVNPATGVIIVRLGRSLGGLSGEAWTRVLMAISDGIR